MQQIADNRVCQVLTCLPEKFVVDFANGIDVAQEHIRTAGERTFFRRLKEGLTGEGAARQNAINASLAQGVEASLRWLTEMTTSLATTNYAIIPGVLAVFAERRKDSFGPYVRLMSVTLN
ncbi:DUF987 family protein [Escherichia coli]|nr:DUF987 family protein [Escherichia coli]RRB29130.1 DUF987 family protein [Escherichia coli]